jgi:hypothetical protein
MLAQACHVTASRVASVAAKGNDVHCHGADGLTAADALSKRCSNDESR